MDSKKFASRECQQTAKPNRFFVRMNVNQTKKLLIQVSENFQPTRMSVW